MTMHHQRNNPIVMSLFRISEIKDLTLLKHDQVFSECISDDGLSILQKKKISTNLKIIQGGIVDRFEKLYEPIKNLPYVVY